MRASDLASVRAELMAQRLDPAGFRAALLSVPPLDRDRWLDALLEIEGVLDDGPQLPKGCAPYLPCGVETLLQVVDHTPVGASDVFIDVGAGLARATTFVHLMTGASAIGLEIQPELVAAGSDLCARLNTSRIVTVQGDAARLTGLMVIGTVFFFYCPFSGARLERVLAELEPIAATRTIRVCCVDLELPEQPWLELAARPSEGLAIYRSTLPTLDPLTSRRA